MDTKLCAEDCANIKALVWTELHDVRNRMSECQSTYMVNDVARKDVGHGGDGALGIDGVVVSLKCEQHWKYEEDSRFTWTRNRLSWRENVNFTLGVRESEEATRQDGNEICKIYE